MKNRVIVIGGAGGIGSMIVRKYAANGYHVVIGDVNEEAGKRAAHTTKGSGAFVPVDVIDDDSIRRFSQEVTRRWKWASHVVSVAGRAIEGEFGGLAAANPDTTDRSIRLNLRSHIVLVKALLPLVEASPHPNKTVTLISSINAVKGFGLPAYSAAKAGLSGFVRATCDELGRKGIRINAVLPGSVDTPLTRKEPKDHGAMLRGTTLGRIATADEIAGVVFAVTDLMTCVTGQDVIADCGQTIKALA